MATLFYYLLIIIFGGLAINGLLFNPDQEIPEEKAICDGLKSLAEELEKFPFL